MRKVEPAFLSAVAAVPHHYYAMSSFANTTAIRRLPSRISAARFFALHACCSWLAAVFPPCFFGGKTAFSPGCGAGREGVLRSSVWPCACCPSRACALIMARLHRAVSARAAVSAGQFGPSAEMRGCRFAIIKAESGPQPSLGPHRSCIAQLYPPQLVPKLGAVFSPQKNGGRKAGWWESIRVGEAYYCADSTATY